MNKHLSVCALLALSASIANVANAEGHEPWWWDCKDAEMIVSAEVDYGSSPYYTISWLDEKGNQQTNYYILGTLKIKDYLYVGSHNRYLDAYKFLFERETKRDSRFDCSQSHLLRRW